MRTILTWSGLLLASFAAAVAANGGEIVVKDEAQTRADRVQFLLDGMRAGTTSIELDPALLGWKDIPALLRHADSTLPIKVKETELFLPRGKNRPLTEGMVAVFLIERIRRGEEGWILQPICQKQNDDRNKPGSSEPTEKELAQLYTAWWGRVKDLDATKGAQVDPLQGARIFWRMFGC